MSLGNMSQRAAALLTRKRGFAFESTYADTGAGTRVAANQKTYVMEVIMGTRTASIYKYTVSHVVADETTDRVLVGTLVGAKFGSNLKLMAYINRSVSGLFPRLPNPGEITLYGRIYDPTSAEWSEVSKPTLYNKPADTIESDPPNSTNKGAWYWLAENVPFISGVRAVLGFWPSVNIVAGTVSMPCLAAIAGHEED